MSECGSVGECSRDVDVSLSFACCWLTVNERNRSFVRSFVRLLSFVRSPFVRSFVCSLLHSFACWLDDVCCCLDVLKSATVEAGLCCAVLCVCVCGWDGLIHDMPWCGMRCFGGTFVE